MNITVPLVLGTLAVVFGCAVAAGLGIYRLHARRAANLDPNDTQTVDGMGGAVGFIGGAAAFLLSVLMLSSLDHYNGTKAIVANEALAYSAAFEGTDGLAPADKTAIQRDLVCLMRSVATNSWAAAVAEDLSGSDNTHSWRRRVDTHANAAATQTKAQEDSLSTLKDKVIDASGYGQERLLAAESDLPLALWILVYVSIFVLTAILTALLRAYPSRTLAVTALAAVLIVSTAMLWTLATFDEPFTQGDGVYISPRALNAVMVRLQHTYPGPAWDPCEMLAKS